MKKLVGILVLAACMANAANAQEIVKIKNGDLPKDGNSICNNIVADTMISFTGETYTHNMASSKWKDEILFTCFSSNASSDTIVLYGIHTNPVCVDTIFIYEPGFRSVLKNNLENGISLIAHNSKKLVINTYNSLYVYDRIGKNKVVKEKILKINEYFRKMLFLNDSILLLSNNHYSLTPQTSIITYNLYSGKIIGHISPRFNNILLTYFSPNKYIDTYGNRILWANRSEYSFLTYDENLNLKDSTYFPTSEWRNLSSKTIRKAKEIDKFLAINIIECIQKEYSSIDQLQWAYFINENHILCVHKFPEEHGSLPLCKIDIWEENSGTWTLKKSFDDYAEQADILDRRSFALEFLAGNEIFILEDKIVKLGRDYVEKPVGLPKMEYWKQYHEISAERDPFVQVTIYSHTLNK